MESGSLPNKSIQDDKFLNALAEAFRLQESILNAIHLSIISTTLEGVISSMNKQAEILFGYSAEELIGKATPFIFHDIGEVSGVAEAIAAELGIRSEPVFDVFAKKISVTNAPYRAEWKVIRKNGDTLPSMISMNELRDEEGVIIGYLIVTQDISDRKAADAKAEAAEQKFRLLAENVPGVIYLCHNDETYSMIYLNERVRDLTGYSADDFIQGKISFVKLYHPEDFENIFKVVDQALANQKSFKLEYRLQHRSGEWRWVEETGVGVYDNGQLLLLEGFINDITPQKESETRLQKVAEENLRVFNNPVNLNAIAAFDGFFKRLSPSWQRTLGWTPEELLEKPFIEFVHPDDREATREAASYIASGNHLFTFENRYRCKDGTYKWLLWGSASDVKSKLIYASAIDITERKKSEEELLHSKRNLETAALKLREQNKQLDEFAHIISHNLRSPIGNIQALINLLDENSNMDDYKLIYDKLKNVSKNLAETMNDLMDTLKVRTNTNIEKSEIRFKDVLDKVVQSLEGDLIMAEAAVTFDFNEVPSVFFPKAYLESIFQNLLSNAIKYRAPRRPAVYFESSIVDNQVELRVSDNGLGIDLEKYGDKLFGLHKTFHQHSEARGVGLFLIRTQLESLGGSIRAESTVGKGTTFIIRFG
jgi:PAS domain S-box-containing protein